jgi:hypothetical protein
MRLRTLDGWLKRYDRKCGHKKREKKHSSLFSVSSARCTWNWTRGVVYLWTTLADADAYRLALKDADVETAPEFIEDYNVI